VYDLRDGTFVTGVQGDDLTFPVQDEEDAEEEWGDDERLAYFGQAHAVLAEGRVWMPAYRDDGEAWRAQVVGLDPRSGEQVWGYLPDPERDNEVDSSVAVSDGTLFLVEILRDVPQEEDRARLHAVDIASGHARWVRSFGSCAGSPVVAGSTVYVSAFDGAVSAFDARTGEARWTAEAGGKILHPCFVNDFGDQYHGHGLAVLLGDGVLYVWTDAGVVALKRR
jgi:outer membrane protein assembly factor BamB